MKIKVLLGSVKFNEKVYAVGEVLELEEKQARAIIRNGVAEEVLQEVAKPEVKVEKTEEPKKEEKKIEKPEAKVVEEVKPSMDWTQKEIVEYGVSKGLEFPEGATKREMLEIIEGGK